VGLIRSAAKFFGYNGGDGAPVSSLFLPPVPTQPIQGIFAKDKQRIRKERPFPTYQQTRWIQKEIENAHWQADQGNLQVVGRLSRSIQTDDVAGGVLDTRSGGLIRLKKQFRGTESVIADFENRGDKAGLWDKIFPPGELIALDKDFTLCGVAVGRLIPLPDRPYPVFCRFDPEYLLYRWWESRWYYRCQGGVIPITPGDGSWVLHCKTHLEPWKHGAWSAAGRAWIAKDHAISYLNNYNFKFSTPYKVAVSPLGASEPQRRGFLQRLIAAAINASFDLPSGWDIKLLELTGTGHEVMINTIHMADRAFMIQLAGQTLTTEGGEGFANADVGLTIRADLIQGNGDALAATWNEQVLPPVIDHLYGSGSSLYVAWDTTPSRNVAAEAQAVATLGDAIAKAHAALAPYGLRVDANEMCVRARIPTIALPAGAEPLALPAAPATPPKETAPPKALDTAPLLKVA
jgi:hypothetical protein